MSALHSSSFTGNHIKYSAAVQVEKKFKRANFLIDLLFYMQDANYFLNRRRLSVIVHLSMAQVARVWLIVKVTSPNSRQIQSTINPVQEHAMLRNVMMKTLLGAV